LGESNNLANQIENLKSKIVNRKWFWFFLSYTHPMPLALEGWVSVLAALEANRRPITAIYLQRDKDLREGGRIQAASAKRGVEIKMASADEIDALAQGKSHGGVLALTGERKYQTLDELIAGQKEPFIVMLDGVEDPFNYGQAIRALYAAGAHGLVVSERNWDTALAVVTRASAGASEYMPTARVADVKDTISFFKSHGFQIAATAKDPKSKSIYSVDLHGSLFMLIGGERRGLNAATLALCEVLLSIPYGRDFKAELDVTSSTAVLAFAVMQQRVWPQRKKKGSV
jgi:23S rRNA (guanosine2251-2'-O)-methyltransferase